MHVLIHEALHMTGELDEARTECRALQLDAQMALLLGDEAEARHVAEVASSIYPRMPRSYRSSECVAEGAWDETPDDGVWL